MTRRSAKRLDGDDMHAPDEPRAWARVVFLAMADRLAPELLDSLAAGPVDDEAALAEWAARWGLADPWCLDAARATRRAWADEAVPWPGSRHRHGFVVPDEGGSLEGPRDVRAIVKDSVHFVWLVRYQVGGESTRTIAARDAAGRPQWIQPTTIRDALVEGARLLGLTLRPARRGRRPGVRDTVRRTRSC